MTPPIWTSRSAGIVRAALLPTALALRAGAELRRRAYATGIARRYRPPVPTVCVGNLSVGGTGKTPLAQWVARYAARRGLRPGVLLRGHGGDEAPLHATALPAAVVVADPDRPRGARRAVASGARALILDDGFQRFDLARDLDLVLVSADAVDAVRWTLPAGPWREPWSALRRAGVVIVTRKAASEEAVTRTLERVRRHWPGPIAVLRLTLSSFGGLRSGRRVEPSNLAGRRVMAVAGVGDPGAFAAQLRALGAHVTLRRRPDHHPFPDRDIRGLTRLSAEVDYVVLTAKDAVKLRERWPAHVPEPLVADLSVTWDRGRATVEAALAEAFTAIHAQGRRVGGGRRT